jgi:uncharacterized integral membrane protein
MCRINAARTQRGSHYFVLVLLLLVLVLLLDERRRRAVVAVALWSTREDAPIAILVNPAFATGERLQIAARARPVHSLESSDHIPRSLH